MRQTLWACPVCKQSLQTVDNGVICDNAHHYDRAKQGFVNLMLANQKRSVNPGDNREMVDARRLFLASGHYDFLVQALAESLMYLAAEDMFRLLDLGCGGGFYIKRLHEAFPNGGYWGVDISKEAVKRACGFAQNAHFAVGSSYSIPVQDSSFDAVLSVFAPFDSNEVKRVLVPGGILIRVSPGADHFRQIKQALYPEYRPHTEPAIPEGAAEKSKRQIFQSRSLEADLLQALLNMTPLHIKGDAEAKARLIESAPTTVDFDFVVQVLSFD